MYNVVSQRSFVTHLFRKDIEVVEDIYSLILEMDRDLNHLSLLEEPNTLQLYVYNS